MTSVRPLGVEATIMKITKTLSLFAITTALAFPATVSAFQDDPLPGKPVQGEMEMTLLENAVEFEYLNVALIGKSSGTVTVKRCEACQPAIFKITAETKLFVADKEVPMQQVVRHKQRAGVMFYEPDTSNLTRIKIY